MESKRLRQRSHFGDVDSDGMDVGVLRDLRGVKLAVGTIHITGWHVCCIAHFLWRAVFAAEEI